MKIIELKMENIHSLYGKNTINFEKSFPESLFLISGDTGAGKSSILDSITLALYGKIGRYEGDKINENIISKGEHSSFAQVVFSCASGIYTARWSIKRASKQIDGKVQSAKRQLSDKDGVVLFEKGREIDKKIEEITGLNYDRFVKALMLQQGNFKRFIASSDGEKGELLEKITGDTIYSEISKKSHEIVKVKEAEKTNILSQKDILNKMSEDEIFENKEKRLKLLSEVKELEELLEKYKKFRDYYLVKGLLNEAQGLLIKLPSTQSDEAIVSFYDENKESLDLYSFLKSRLKELDSSLVDINEDKVQKNELFIVSKNDFLKFYKKMQETLSFLERDLEILNSLKLEIENEKNKKTKLIEDCLERKEGFSLVLEKKEECNKNILIYKKIKENNLKVSSFEIEIENKKNKLKKIKNKNEDLKIQHFNKLKELNEKLNENCIVRIQGEVTVGDICPICGNNIKKINKEHSSFNIKKIKKEESSLLSLLDASTLELTECELALKELEINNNLIKKTIIELEKETTLDKEELKETVSKIKEIENELIEINLEIEKSKEEITKNEEEYSILSQKIIDDKLFLESIENEIKKIKKNKNFNLILSEVDSFECKEVFESVYIFAESKNDGQKYLDMKQYLDKVNKIFREKMDEKIKIIHNLKECENDLDLEKIDSMFLESNFENKYHECKQRIGVNTEKRDFYLKRIKNLNDNIIEMKVENVDIDEESLADEIEKSSNKKDKIIKEIYSIESELKLNDKNKETLKMLGEKEEKIDEDLFYLKKIKKLIGSADGKQFSKYVQAITLNNMVLISNRYLQDVEFRYILNRQEDKFLSLEVIDTHQNNIHRPITSLSGGESFIVALILAIALSDIAGRKSQIESLFIDEGFGSLDEVELERIFEVLNKIKSKNRTIGIISHLESVREKVLNKIEVKKIGNGKSEINIV